MSDASSLHCPNCGAAVDPDQRRCPYCKARLATVSCPACFALMFDSAAYCPNCGAHRARSVQQASVAKCPGCRQELTRIAVGSTALMECGACDGVWVEADDFERLCADREAQAAVIHRFAAHSSANTERIRYRPCVRCQKMMNRVNFGRLSGIVVDVCRGHGTYLDAGELHQIVAFIHEGGLDRARQRQVEELREQERELRALEARLEQDRRVVDPHRARSREPGAAFGTSLLELVNLIADRTRT